MAEGALAEVALTVLSQSHRHSSFTIIYIKSQFCLCSVTVNYLRDLSTHRSCSDS
ncbi:MAG: hypothetical protein ACFWUL_11310 [Dialister sp.]